MSTNPVFIKKIYLKIWRLRDELESIVQDAKEKSEPIDMDYLTQEYKQDSSTTLKIVDEGDKNKRKTGLPGPKKF